MEKSIKINTNSRLKSKKRRTNEDKIELHNKKNTLDLKKDGDEEQEFNGKKSIQIS